MPSDFFMKELSRMVFITKIKKMKEDINKIPLNSFFQFPFGRRMLQVVQRMEHEGKVIVYYITKRSGVTKMKSFNKGEKYFVHWYKNKTEW